MTPEDEERHRQEWIKAGKEAMKEAEGILRMKKKHEQGPGSILEDSVR